MHEIKRRLSPEESRAMALVAARELLLEAGPQAVTLMAVAARVGRTHANLLHHFGSAAGLQRDLAAYLAETVCQTIGAAVKKNRAEDGDPQDVVDMTFAAFGEGGAGALASWMILSGNEDALDPIVETIHRLVDDLGEDGHGDRHIHDETLLLVLLAMGDALMGAPMAASLGLPRGRAREMAGRLLRASIGYSKS